MYIEESFRILGIEKTADQSRIKKAYAKKVRYCHPEDQPDEWRRLHDAYQNALKYAKGQTVTVTPPGYFKKHVDEDNKPDNGDEFEQIFDSLSGDVQQENLQAKEQFLAFLKRKRRTVFVGVHYWEQLFYMEEYAQCREDEECVKALLKLVTKKRFSYRSFDVIYRNLWELKMYLQAMQKYILVREVEKAIERVEHRWDFTEYNQERIGTSRWKKGIWIIWETFFQIPFLLRYMLSALIMAICFYATDGNDQVFMLHLFYMLFEYFHLMFKKNGAKKPDIKKTQKENTGGKRILQGILIVVMLFAFIGACASWSEDNKKEQITIVMDTSNADWNVLLYANLKKDLNKTAPTYIFYLFDEGKSSERVYVLTDTRQSSFETLLNGGGKIYIRGVYETVEADDLVVDALKYFRESNRESANFLDIFYDSSIMESAEPWLGEVFWVDAFGAYKN